jgi:hypothetical protein
LTTTAIRSHQRWNREFTPTTMVAEEELEHMWRRLNYRHFKGKLPAPKLAVYPPYRDDALATFAGYTDGFAVIDIDPAIVNGTAAIVASASREGRRRLIEDVLLHEAVHCAVYRTGRWDQQAAHTGAFEVLAASIGNQLGLPRSHDPGGWPGNVRPADYYAGAVRPHNAHAGTAPSKAVAPSTAALVASINATTEQIRRLFPPVTSR